MKSRAVPGVTVVLSLLLAGAIAYPGALTAPYEPGPREPVVISHESTEAFTATVADRDAARESAVPVDDLSESQRRAFEAAKAQEPAEYDAAAATSGRQSFQPPICDDSLLVCDEYEELPEAPSNGSSSAYISENATGHQYGTVEDTDGDLYLVRVGFRGAYMGWSLTPIFERLSKLLSLGPFALFLAYRGVTDDPPGLTRTAVGCGAALIAFVLAYPYLLLLATDSTPSWHHLVLMMVPPITWVAMVAEIAVHRGTNGTEESQSTGA